MTHLPSLPDGTLIDVFAHHAPVFAPLHDFGEQVMRGPSPFGPGERELMAAYVSRLNGCAFCEQSHADAAARFGMDPSLAAALASDPERAALPDGLRPVFRYLRALTLDPARVSAGDVRAVIDAGWGEEGVASANLVAGFFALMNRIVEGLGIEADARTVAMAGRQLHERGYIGIGEMVERMRRATAQA